MEALAACEAAAAGAAAAASCGLIIGALLVLIRGGGGRARADAAHEDGAVARAQRSLEHLAVERERVGVRAVGR